MSRPVGRPLRRFEESGNVRRSGEPLMRLAALQSVLSDAVPSLSGCLAPALAFRFPDDLRGSSRFTGPRDLTIPGSSSRELRLLSRVRLVAVTCPPAATAGRLPWGLVLLRDVDVGSPLGDRLPSSCLRSAPGVSHALDGLLLLTPRGLVSSHCHVRASTPQGFSPAPSPCRLIADSASVLTFLPSRLHAGRTPRAPAPRARPPRP